MGGKIEVSFYIKEEEAEQLIMSLDAQGLHGQAETVAVDHQKQTSNENRYSTILSEAAEYEEENSTK